jgi:hypothetical protein
MERVVCCPTMEALLHHVHYVLCMKYHLDPAQTPLQKAVITRRGKPCGLFFLVQGPRLLKNFAVWAGDEDRVLFYDCRGERFEETRLSEAPDPRRLNP